MIDTACVRVCVEVNYIRYIYVNLHPQTAFNADNIYAYVHCVRHAAGCVYLFSSAYAEYSFFPRMLALTPSFIPKLYLDMCFIRCSRVSLQR